MKLYHFISEMYAIHALTLQRLKISRINDLNDPFEFLGADLLNPLKRRAFQNLKDDINSKIGMVCFSNDWRNPLLWSHYADRHRGMVLGFEVDEKFADKVLYTMDRANVEYDIEKGIVKDAENVIDKIKRTKFEDWKYENEYRIFFNLTEETKEGPNFFFEFSDNVKLIDVRIGLNCSITKEKIEKIVSNYPSKIRVKKVRLARREFKIVEETASPSPADSRPAGLL